MVLVSFNYIPGDKKLVALEALEKEISNMIVEVLNLEDVDAAAMDPTEPLFGDGLGLDSIDALEIGAAISKKYGIVLKSQEEETRSHFETIRALANFIESSNSSA